MDNDPKHISNILPDAVEAIRRGQIWPDDPLLDRVQRDALQERAELAAEVARLQELADVSEASDDDRRLLDEKKIELRAFGAHAGIEQAP